MPKINNNMQSITEKEYTNWYSELNIDVTGGNSEKILNQERECLIHLAKTKLGDDYKGGAFLNIAWKIGDGSNQKYYKETVEIK